MTTNPSKKKPTSPSHLIDCIANSLHVLPHFPHTALILLHEANDDGAALLAIIGVIVHLLQLNDTLRIHPEGIWEHVQGSPVSRAAALS